MADLKISQLTDGGASQATDEYVIARSGANYRIDGASVAAAATSVGTLTSLTVSGLSTVTGTADTTFRITSTGASGYSVLSQQITNASATGSNYMSISVARDNVDSEPVSTLTLIANNTSVANRHLWAINNYATRVLTVTASGNLGLGVTPSAWTQYTGFQIGALGGLSLGGYPDFGMMAVNAYNVSGTYKYAATGYYSSLYRQLAGVHSWHSAANGTAGNTISFTQLMTLDASGNLGIGTTTGGADGKAAVVYNGSGAARLALRNNTTGDAAGDGFQLAVSGSTAYIEQRENADLIITTNNTERARITSTGAVLVNVTSVGGKLYVYNPATNFETNTIKAHDANASTTSDGVLVAVAERNTTNNTFYALGYYNTGAAAFKFRVADSGDVTNTNGSYTAISDAKLKQDIIDAPSQWDDIKAVRFRKYRFKADVAENPDAPYLLGVVAQELEQTSPGCIDEHPDYEEQEVTDEDGNVTTERVKVGVTKSFKQSVLLMKAAVALQEAMARIEALEARLEALEA